MALIRTIPPAMQAALDSGHFYPVTMVHLDWPVAPVFAHGGVGTIEFEGEDWLGVGEFGQIQLPEESPSLAATAAGIRLVGVPPAILAMLDDPIRNRAARVLFGVVTTRGGNVLVADPVEVFAGYMDAMRYVGKVSGLKILHGIELQAATGPSARSAASFYHSYEDQITAFPGDTFGRLFINNEAEAASLTWPEA
jgi:hypothetical protein